MQSSKGLFGLIGRAKYYDMLMRLIGRRDNMLNYTNNYIRPFKGCHLLDIGCGTAEILRYLPETIGSYTGFDPNVRYIISARKKWGSRGNFFSCRVEDIDDLAIDFYDIVVSNAVLHHLSDFSAMKLFEIAFKCLKKRGRLVTYDCVFIKNQNAIAKLAIKMDRGKAVRWSSEYRKLAKGFFDDISEHFLHDTLRIPYTIYIMECQK